MGPDAGPDAGTDTGTDEGRFAPGADLEFEHVGTLVLDDRLLLCDVEFLPPHFAGMTKGKINLGLELPVQPGTWQVLVAYTLPKVPDAQGDPPPPEFVLLTHDRELEAPAPLDHAEALGLLSIHSGRFCALDPELRSDPDIQRAVLEAPREQVPCMLTPLAEPGGDAPAPGASPRGTLIDLDRAGTFSVYAPAGQAGQAGQSDEAHAAVFLTQS